MKHNGKAETKVLMFSFQPVFHHFFANIVSVPSGLTVTAEMKFLHSGTSRWISDHSNTTNMSSPTDHFSILNEISLFVGHIEQNEMALLHIASRITLLYCCLLLLVLRQKLMSCDDKC